MEEELQKKETQWRLTSLKRHAETNKLEQALKVSQKNEGLLKKKADMLELSLMSHQKSMEKGRAKIVQEQLKERNGQLEQQHELHDIHANGAPHGCRMTPRCSGTPAQRSPLPACPLAEPHCSRHSGTLFCSPRGSFEASDFCPDLQSANGDAGGEA